MEVDGAKALLWLSNEKESYILTVMVLEFYCSYTMLSSI